MWAVLVGVLLLLLKWLELGPVAGWPWWAVLAPFGAAAVWWAISDSMGWTQQRAIRKMEERKVARRERDMKALGLDVHTDRRVRVLREAGSKPKAAPPPPPPSAKDPTN